MKIPNFLYSRFAFILGIILLLVPSMLHAYLLMPFPGSQDLEAIGTAYFLEHSLLFTRLAGILFLVVPLASALRRGGIVKRTATILFIFICFGIYYFTDFSFSAEVMFREPTTTSFALARDSYVDQERLIVGIEHNGRAKAYPINYIGYHHKIQDSVGGMPVLVTYCTMCRTARVYNPILEGKHQEFRLVGARHYNAVIEDESTGSWWYQATGEAAAGPMKGARLEDIPFEQVTLRAWIEKYPSTLILQPDTLFNDEYADLSGYDRTMRVEKDATGNFPAWQRKNWVVGVTLSGSARAYDWNALVSRRIVNDMIGSVPIVLVVEDDSASYHVWSRIIGGKTLELVFDQTTQTLKDNASGTSWNWRGECTGGYFEGTRLEPLQASQEYWHSWLNFHPNTTRWKN